MDLLLALRNNADALCDLALEALELAMLDQARSAAKNLR